jgi:rhomboid family GlyGly-CTERM serine protease
MFYAKAESGEDIVDLQKSITFIIRQAARVPVTLTMAMCAVAIACVPSVGEMLEFDRTRIAAGEIWRLATGHLTHWSVEHLQWDLVMFVTVGAVCEIRNPRRMRLCVVAAAASVSAVVFFGFPTMEAYRGLSGIDTALFTLLAVDLLRDAWRHRNFTVATAAGFFLAGFAVKTAYEAITGQALFVDQHSAGFDLLVWDHIVAAAAGMIVACYDTCFKNRYTNRLYWRAVS